MKKLLLNFILIALPLAMFAQVPSGDKLNGNITGTDAVTGEEIDLQAWLDDDKTVIVDVFATWCGPCWSFHLSGYLEELHELHGPDGDNTIRVIGIEADSRTNAADLVGTGTNTLGDWTDGVKYNIIDSDAHNSVLNVSYFPTLYIIRPDGTIIEMGDFRGQTGIWDRILAPVAKDASILGALPSASFCKEGEAGGGTLTVQNFGNEDIAEAIVEVKLGDEVEMVTITDLGVFRSVNVNMPSATVTETTEVSATIVSMDGVAPAAGTTLIQASGTVVKAVTNDQVVTVAVTTDFYPGEFSWSLTTDLGDNLASATYQPGPEAAGGGGADANRTFEYEVWIGNTDVECLSMNLVDSYGDGLTAFNATLPTPGVMITNSSGDVIRSPLTSDYAFRTSARIEFGAELSPSNTDITDAVSKFEVFPNPVSDVLNLDIQVRDAFQIEVSNLMGQKVMTAAGTQTTLDVSNLAVGAYMISIRTAEGVMTKKFNKI